MMMKVFVFSFLLYGFVQSLDPDRVVSVHFENEGFKISPGLSKDVNVVAWANYTNDQANAGWMYLEITTSESFPDHIQAEAAGYAEGYLTKDVIQKYYKEFYSNIICPHQTLTKAPLVQDDTLCEVFHKFREQLKLNDEFVKRSVALKSKTDPYWHMVDLVYTQMDGIMKGFMANSKENNEILDDDDFDTEYGIKLLNLLADIWDYFAKYEHENEMKMKQTKPSCSVLIKLLPELKELFVGHNTWHVYSALAYKFLKKYSFNYHTLPDSKELIPGHTMTMSSYAATILSLDDFLTLSSGLVTTETTLNIYNKSLYQHTEPTTQLFEPIRVLVANRLSKSGKQWTDIMSKYNGGTYNNQWMVVDYNKLQTDGSIQDGLLWVYEQIPGKTYSSDLTSILRDQGYWISYNRAFYDEVYNVTGAREMTEKYGNYFSYTDTPRAKIMKREQEKVTDEASMIEFMRYNDFQNDPEAVVDGCNAPIPAGSVANRLDLTLLGSKCEWEEFDDMVGHTGYGALDMKFVTRELLEDGQRFWSVAGPMHNDRVAPFSWANTNLTEKPLYTPITTFDFQPGIHNWRLGDKKTDYSPKQKNAPILSPYFYFLYPYPHVSVPSLSLTLN